jgi:hypothetical protein
VRDAAANTRFEVTNANPALRFVGVGSATVDFDATSHSVFLKASDTVYAPTLPPRANQAVVLDPATVTGKWASLAIGGDGLPVVAYLDETLHRLMVAHCGNPTCTSGNGIAAVDATGWAGSFASLAIGVEGFPVISYYEAGNNKLKVARCVNAACSTGTVLTTPDPATNVGLYTSVIVGLDGKPIVAYAGLGGGMKVLHCGSDDCSTGNTITVVDSSVYLNASPSIAIGTDGLPVIAYLASGTLKVLRCSDSACSAVESTMPLLNVSSQPQSVAMTIGNDGFPVIAHADLSSLHVVVTKCRDAACTGQFVTNVVDYAGFTGSHLSITIGTDGYPVLSYRDADTVDLDLRVTKCGSADCATGNTSTWVDRVGDVGLYSSIAVGVDGMPVIAYFDATNSVLKAVHCANPFCLNNWSRR